MKTANDRKSIRTRRLTVRTIVISTVLIIGAAIFAEACGPFLVFRAYLEANALGRLGQNVYEALPTLPPERFAYQPYAGMAFDSASVTVQRVRDEYQASSPDDRIEWSSETVARLRSLIGEAHPANAAERSELELLRCKVDMRGAHYGDDTSLAAVQACFESYLRQSRPAALSSEARGWLAHTEFLRGQQAQASKIYLDELKSPASNIQRKRLITSLAMISPTSTDLEGYFDTPEHALFAAKRIRPESSLAAELVKAFERHRNLFRTGVQSDELAAALMRLSLQVGAPSETLRYSERVRTNSEVRRGVEFNWLAGAARYQTKDYAGAETPLLRVLDSSADDPMRKALAANLLIDVYSKLNRPADQLWAAFQAGSLDLSDELRDKTPVFGDTLDLPYLLDLQLSEADLAEYLRKRPNTESRGAFVWPLLETHAAVRYAIGVRRARREEYTEALQSVAGLSLPPDAMTARSWQRAAELLADTRRAGLSNEQRLQALYDYAFFLSENEDKVFFNDTIWLGYQRYAFLRTDPAPNPSPEPPLLTEVEMQKLISMERTFRDQQEEYWRAYQILDRIVQEAGPAPIGARAAERALYCLRRINTDRFGRADEIQAAEDRLTRRLSGRGD
jgi:hypothetical protein